MKTSITTSRIKELEKQYGKFIPESSGNGWLLFENALISSNESVVLTSKRAIETALSHHPTKEEAKSIYGLILN